MKLSDTLLQCLKDSLTSTQKDGHPYEVVCLEVSRLGHSEGRGGGIPAEDKAVRARKLRADYSQRLPLGLHIES